MLVHVVATLAYGSSLVTDCGGHPKVFVRVSLSRPVVAFAGEMQSMDDVLTQKVWLCSGGVGFLAQRM
jgi:hypothetical protein